MPTDAAVKAKIQELEKITAIIAEKYQGTAPNKSTLEVTAHQLCSISEAHASSSGAKASVNLPNDYGYVDWWSPWGYRVHLTKKAINALNNLGGVAESAAAVAASIWVLVGGALATTSAVTVLIASTLAVRAKVMYWIADDGDLDLYSPWVAIVALIPVKSSSTWNSKEDRMGFSAFRDGKWSDGKPFIGGSATSGGRVKQAVADSVPSFGTYRGRQYAVFNSNNGPIYYCAYDAKAEDDGWHGGWSDSIQTGMYGRSPALVEYDGALYMAQRHSSAEIWWCRYDHLGWTNEVALRGGGAYTSDRVGMAVFNSKIYLVARGASDEDLWWSIYDGSSWSSYSKVGASSAYGPALATFGGKLHMVARGAGSDERLWHYRFDGSKWESGALDSVLSKASPALAVFGGKLYCAAVGMEGAIWYMSYSDGSWSTYTKTQLNSRSGPSLSAYRDYLSNREDLLLCYDPRT